MAQVPFDQLLKELRRGTTPKNGELTDSHQGRVADPLTGEEITRYSRHLLLPQIGFRGQLRLKTSRVLLIGAGSSAAIHLASAGVGKIGLLDPDPFEISELTSHSLFTTEDQGKFKGLRAFEKLRQINPLIKSELHHTELNSENTLKTLRDYDLVIASSGGAFPLELISDACVWAERPHLLAQSLGFQGQVAFFPAQGPCYRCLHPEEPLTTQLTSASEDGVLGPLEGLVSSLMAAEAIKYLAQAGISLHGQWMHVDMASLIFRRHNLIRDPHCPTCKIHQPHPPVALKRPETSTKLPAAVGVPEIEPKQLDEKMRRGQFFLLLDIRTDEEYEIGHIRSAHHIPLMSLKARLRELSRQTEIVIYCKTGQRSRLAVAILKEAGFRKLRHLKGGYLAWREQVEPSLPKY